MPTFTLISEVEGVAHVSQEEVATPEEAVAAHIGRFPLEDGAEPDDENLPWLHHVMKGLPVTLVEVAGCVNTWMWKDGANTSPQCITYIVRTDVGDVGPR